MPRIAPRAPQQARSRATRERLLDAAEALVAANGFEGAGVALMVRRAGTSVGAFYSHFRDKQALLLALHDRFLELAVAELDAVLDPLRLAELPVARALQAIVGALVQIHRQRRGLLRAFALEGCRDPAFQSRRDRLLQHLGTRVSALLRGRAIGHHHPERAGAFGLAVIASTLESALLFDRLRAGALAPTDDDLAAELARLFAAYLGVEGS